MAAQDQRPAFYESQYLSADDLNAAVGYGRVQLGRHELGPHTWGISIGLYLIEAPTAGGPSRQNVILVPGMAIDGFARAIIVPKRERLPESLFADVPYDASVDDPSKNSGKPPGRFVRVWLEYDETPAVPPRPGFETCDAGDAFARVQESYRFVVGDKSALTDRRSPISIAGQSMDAAKSLFTFDMTAPQLDDASVPHQVFPDGTTPTRWLVPIGFVRWVANSGGGGYFVDRNIKPDDAGDDRIRKFRRYAGVTTEQVNAVDGAIVLRDRGADPGDPGKFQARLESGDPTAGTLQDLVWAEGNLRVVGDARLAAGALRFTDLDGKDESTPLSVERLGDVPAVTGQRKLAAIIGPDAQATNRFVVATVVKDDPDPTVRQLSEKLSVLSGGNVGVGKDSPDTKLHVKGDRVRLESADGAKRIDLATDGTNVELRADESHLVIRSTDATHNVLINPDATDGFVGIGTSQPAYTLDVKSKGIKLGLEANGGGQLVLANNAGDNKIYLEAFDTAGTGSAKEMLFTGRFATSLPQVTFVADRTVVKGQLSVGTDAPASALHIVGDGIRVENPTLTKRIQLFTNGSEVDLYTDTNALSIRSENHNCLINWFPADGNVGIGLGAPQEKLHVGGNFIRVEGAGNEAGYLGGDSIGADVQIGSMNSAIGHVTCWNTANGATMEINAAQFNNVSDAALKTNIRPLENALDLVSRLRGVRFHWKARPGVAKPDRPQLGVIAQEVAEVLPEAVGGVRGHASVSYSSLVSVLLEATKELKGQNDDLRRELDALKDAVAALGGARQPPEDRKSPKKKGNA